MCNSRGTAGSTCGIRSATASSSSNPRDRARLSAPGPGRDPARAGAPRRRRGRPPPGRAGFDLRSLEDLEVGPGERAMVPTGVAAAIPEGHAGLVLPRSGLASKHGLTLANAPGLIDAGYRGELICSVVNLDRDEIVKIARGDRIARRGGGAGPGVRP